MHIRTLRPWQNCRHFTEDLFTRIYAFFNENVWISLKISLKFVAAVQINCIPALVQTMAWCWPGDKPLSKPMLFNLLTHMCVTQPQWDGPVTSLWLHVLSNTNISLSTCWLLAAPDELLRLQSHHPNRCWFKPDSSSAIDAIRSHTVRLALCSFTQHNCLYLHASVVDANCRQSFCQSDEHKKVTQSHHVAKGDVCEMATRRIHLRAYTSMRGATRAVLRWSFALRTHAQTFAFVAGEKSLSAIVACHKLASSNVVCKSRPYCSDVLDRFMMGSYYTPKLLYNCRNNCFKTRLLTVCNPW